MRKTDLERMTDDRNHWRDLAQSLQAQLDDVRDDAEAFGQAGRSVTDTLRHQRSKYRTERNHYQQRITELESLVPWNVINPTGLDKNHPVRKLRSDGKWQLSSVGVTLVARDSDGEEYQCFRCNGYYWGDSAMAARELGMQLLAAIRPVPGEEDLAKIPKGFENLVPELWNAIAELSVVQWYENGDYEGARQRLFDGWIWPKLENADFDIDRRDAHDKFNYFVDTTFANHEKRRKSYQVAGIELAQHGLGNPSEGQEATSE